ncbi:MAG: hypothetical protein K2X72_23005 [Reyranella sp.]|nr:hypothetical protein [Reyranella sp.]
MRNVKYFFPARAGMPERNADGTERLSKEEQRELREQENAKRVADIREGIKRRHLVVTAPRLATNNAIADGTAEEKLRALLALSAERNRPKVM